MPINPYFLSKKSSLLGGFIAFSIKSLKGRSLKTFMSQCSSDSKALRYILSIIMAEWKPTCVYKHICA